MVSFLNTRAQKHDELFNQALEILGNLNSSSSCNKLAATKLVTSCKSIGRNPEISYDLDKYLALEHVRSMYAARLALCELSGAGIPVPSPCRLVNVSPSSRKRLFGGYTKTQLTSSDCEPVPAEELEPCLKSLESRPQWWTSYSNSRQNAMIICQASRSEIDKQDILETYTSILQSSSRLSDGLHEALRVAAEESAKSKAFAHSVDLLRKQTLQEMEESTSSFMVKLSENIESRFGSLAATVSSTMERFHIGVSSLEEVSQVILSSTCASNL